jgi:hypothetical protein
MPTSGDAMVSTALFEKQRRERNAEQAAADEALRQRFAHGEAELRRQQAAVSKLQGLQRAQAERRRAGDRPSLPDVPR